MKNYRMTVQYEGTRYNGWQRQGNTQNTIQGKIEDVLGKMTGHKVEIHGMGRTDKGVHALGQVASFKIETSFSETEITDYLNRYLPEDIAVTELCEADERFHARLSVKSKTYVYRLWVGVVPNVFERRYMHNVTECPDVEKMRLAAEKLLGTHDFKGFSSLKKYKKSTVRTIYNISVKRLGNEIRLEITGSGFLYNMVRIIAGTLLEIGLGKIPKERIDKVLESLSREYAGETLPAKGLTLIGSEYK